MKRTKILGLVLVAVFAMSAVAASAASAETFEGPSWIVNKARLVNPNTKNFTSKGKNFKLVVSKLGITILCKKVTNKGKIIGSAAKMVGTDEAEVTFMECSVEETAGKGCVVSSETKKVTSAAGTIGPITVLTELVSLSKPPVTKAGDLFIEDEETTGGKKEFVTVVLKSCTKATLNGKYNVTGSVVGELGKYKEEKEMGTFELAKANEEAKTGVLNFPATEITKVWKWEKATETYKETSIGLLFGENPATLIGQDEITLAPVETFGWTNT